MSKAFLIDGLDHGVRIGVTVQRGEDFHEGAKLIFSKALGKRDGLDSGLLEVRDQAVYIDARVKGFLVDEEPLLAHDEH